MDVAKHPADPSRTSPLAGLGPALRRLRMRKGLRQFETAAAAEITKAMLSAYENGKRRPSLKTLDQILAALEADLGDLHHALVTERRERARAAETARTRHPGATPAGERRPGGARGAAEPPDELGEPPPPPYGGPPNPREAPYREASPYGELSAGGRWTEAGWQRAPRLDLYHALGIQEPLPPGEERALSEMLLGFVRLLRHLHSRS